MTMIPIVETKLGQLYEADCIKFLKTLEDETVDLAFADPPFNLGKDYTSKINDSLSPEAYLEWCEQWLVEMVRTLKPGGALYLWNIPKWNLPLGAYLGKSLTFRHWISVDIKVFFANTRSSLPVALLATLLHQRKKTRPSSIQIGCQPIAVDTVVENNVIMVATKAR